MGWVEILLTSLVALFAGLNIFQLISFRKYKNKYEAEAEMEEAIADAEKQSALEKRLTAIEQLYDEQGKVIDELRQDILKLTKEKFESNKRIVQLEQENETLRSKVEKLEQELKMYKTRREGNEKTQVLRAERVHRQHDGDKKGNQ